MASKTPRRKSAGSGTKAAHAKSRSSGKGVAKPAAKAVKAPPAPPQPPKAKFRGRLLEQEPLARYTTYRIGGPAKYMLYPADADDVQRGIEMAQNRNLPWVVLGLGSNVLVKDAGFPGVVIRLGKGLDRFEMKGATAIVGAGMPIPILARRTAEAGFVGVERFVGIPGTVGGGIYMNAGCHGAEFSEVVTEITVMDAKGKVKQIARKQISFKYRASNLGPVIVLEAKLVLGEESPAKLKELQSRLFRWRKAGTPYDQPCCGSVFKNPSLTRTAGMLIDEAGLKGHTVGGAQVSNLHANYFINLGNATAADVQKLMEHVKKMVQKKTGVELEPEVRVIG